MKLREKADLCSGSDFWNLEEITRLGIPRVTVSDGPFGVRKQLESQDHLGINESEKAVCFPAGCALAAGFSTDTARKMGETLGRECQAMDVAALLGPAVNIKRSPLCGRNFEYYSEDPLLTGKLAEAWIEGMQSQNVGTSPKHYLANNQEDKRMSSSSDMDERTMREIYMPAFEAIVKNARPWTLMCAYNKIDGIFVSEDRKYLTDILRGEWGFDGLVVSDWGAVNERVDGLKAGLDLEMPSTLGKNDQLIVDAVKSGRLSEKVLDQAVERILAFIFKFSENRDRNAQLNLEADHQTAREIEEECMVLLKNKDGILPLARDRRIAFIGKFAEEPRYQGSGSSHINSFQVDSALDAVSGNDNIVYARGYETDSDDESEQLIQEAVGLAADADAAVIFAGLPESYESEGYDRKHMRMPENQNRLIREVAAVQPDTVVVLHNGAPVEMPWIDDVKGVIETYLGGQAVGSAAVRVLFGDVCPSGRLPESFPLRLEDTPCYLCYGGEGDTVHYDEGLFVGYRYYTSKKMKVLFPFGYGLSYTQFAYSNLKTDSQQLRDPGFEELQVSVDVTNTGDRTGKEVIQLYVSPEKIEKIRPVRELKAFDKVELQPGEMKTVRFTLDKRAFACWDNISHDWLIEGGDYEIQIGRSSEDIVLSRTINIDTPVIDTQVFTLNSTIGEILSSPRGRMVADLAASNYIESGNVDDLYPTEDIGGISPETMRELVNATPLRQLLAFVPVVQRGQLEMFLEMLNHKE